MNQGTSFPKRCLAILMAAILIASNFSGLAQLVHAEGNDGTKVSVGEIVAGNYDLTDAEKELIKSGLLAGSGDTIEYTAPSDGDELIVVDTENKKITVKTYDGWTAAAVAKIYVGETLMETVALADGVGTYTYAENAFSVKVTYTLNVDIDTDVQETLLGAAAILKQGIKNLDDVAGQSGNLYILEQAMPELVNLANTGIVTSFTTFGFSEDCKAAIKVLNDQMTANGGKLDLSVMIEEMDNYSSAEYLFENGKAMQEEVENVVANTTVISVALTTMADNVDFLVPSFVSQETADQLKMLAGVCKNLVDGLSAVSADPWTAANEGTALVVDGVNYAKLDALIAAVTTTSTNVVKNPLFVTEATVAANMSMFNVKVVVALNVINDNETVKYGENTITLTLAEGATAAEIEAAVNASGIVNSAIAAWGDAYVAGKYVASATALPGELLSDITYTITYDPAKYVVELEYEGGAVTLPYGYKYLLPVHADPAKAYDYMVNGEKYPQGAFVTIEDDTEITRSLGKAYTEGDLLSIIADNYGNAKLDAILVSGALLGNVAVNVRYPDAADTSALLTLVDGTLTAVPTYASSYNGLNWAPYSYGANGNENLFSGNTAAWNASSAAVIYRLALDTPNADVKAWLDLAKTLDEEAKGQINALDRLLNYKDVMGQLDRTKLGALKGVIDVTDLHADPAKNAELKAEFTALIEQIIDECLDGNNLSIYKMICEYENEGLLYYYQNSADFLNQLELVSGYLNGLLDSEDKVAAIGVLVNAAGYPEYAEKISNVGGALATLQAELKAPNAAIDLESDNLGKLVGALEQGGAAAYDSYGALYLYSDKLTVTDASQKTVQVFLNGSVAANLIVDRGYVLTQGDINNLLAQLNAAVEAKYGDNVKFYDPAGIDELNALVDVALDANQNIYVTYTAKEYTVVVPGMADQIITIEDLEINLMKSPVSGQKYTYTIDGANVESSTYKFTAEQLETLFVGGTYTVERTVVDLGAETLNNIVTTLNNKLGAGSAALVKDGEGNFVGLNTNLTAGQMMDFILALSAYPYIGLNGQPLMDAGEMSIQTLINAMLSDNDFGSASLIALGENGSGKLLGASMQLGNSADDLVYDDLTLVINLKSVPAQMGTVASALKQLQGTLDFQANNGAMEIVLNLPDKVYGAYLAALLATGYAEKDDMNAVNQQIAFAFLCDYLDAVKNCGADMTTLENTLAMLGKHMDLSSYNGAYNMLMDGMNYTAHEDGLYVGIAVQGSKVIPSLLKLLGMNINESLLGIVKEYKAGGKITVNAHAVLTNTEKTYNAIVLDANAAGITNKFACTSSYNALKNTLANLAGTSIVILLDDVDGDLTIGGSTVILDLNGKTIDGSIKANGKLFIIDSSMDTYNCGGATGNVSGNVSILAGTYNTDVTELLKDGYYVDNGTVRNNLYHIVENNGDVTFVINTDVIDNGMPDVRSLALDIVTDLLMNYFTAAALNVEGNDVYNVNIDDLVALLEGTSKADQLIEKILASIKADGITDLTNTIIADLLNFEALYEALCGDGVVAEYEMTVNPWEIEILKHNDNYLVLNLTSNDQKPTTFNFSLKLEGSNVEYLKKLVGDLAGIVDADITVDIEQPTYADKEFGINVSGSANILVDMRGNTDYAKILAIILAYGNPDKAADVANAIKNDDLVLLKKVIDLSTVKELFNGLKAMSRNVNIAEMAAQVGVEVDADLIAKENIYHVILCAMGKALEELDINGMNSVFGALYNEETGAYELTKENIYRSGEVSISSYSALYNLTAEKIFIQLKLFSTGCEHVWQPATCTTAKYCLICGETEGDPLGHVEDQRTENYVDPTCSVDGGYDVVTFCTVCGEELNRESFVLSATGEHEYTLWVDHPEKEYYEILVCWMCQNTDDYVDERVKTHEHIYEYDYRDASRHYQTCTICGEGSYTYHNWDEGRIVKDPTCTMLGMILYHCDLCDGTKAIGIPMVEHSYDVVVTEPTCTTQGFSTYTCTECGDSFIADFVAPLAHEYGEWILKTPATCEEQGVWYRECVRVCDCGSVEYKYDEATGHNYGDWYITVAPTWTEGEQRRDCLNEGCDCYETEVLAPVGILGDVDGNGVVNSTDAMFVLQYDAWVIGEDDLILVLGDVDGDGDVDSTDAMYILQYDAWMIEKFPVEP